MSSVLHSKTETIFAAEQIHGTKKEKCAAGNRRIYSQRESWRNRERRTEKRKHRGITDGV